MLDRGVTLFHVKGIPVRLHFTLLIFLPYIAYVTTRQYQYLAASLGVSPASITLPPIVWGVLLAVGLFASVLLHELAHAIVALRAGTRVRSITLMMLGGVTAMDDVVPRREATMALAGPLTSLALALVCWGIARVFPLAPGAEVALISLAWMNVVLGLFNLLPAFPMDGGRVLRGLLVPRLGRGRATHVATSIGRWLAVAMALVGLVTFNVILILIAAFVYIGATAERTSADAHEILRGLEVGRFMTGRLGEAHPGEPTGEVARRLLLGDLAGARVVEDGGDDGRTIGIVTAEELAERAARGAGGLPVESAIHASFPTVHRSDDAATTLDALGGGNANAVVVLDEADHIIGLVTAADVRRAMALASIRSR